MADNFNMKQFLMENKLGAYSRLKENEEQLNEYEITYEYGSDGSCYRVDDEGNYDEVDDSYCRRYAGQGVREEKETTEEAKKEIEELKYQDALVTIKQTMKSLGYTGEYDPTLEEGYIFTKDLGDGVMEITLTELYESEEKFTFTASFFPKMTKSTLFGLIKKKVIDYRNGKIVSKDSNVEHIDLGTGMFSLDKPGVEDLIKKAVQRVEQKAKSEFNVKEGVEETEEKIAVKETLSPEMFERMDALTSTRAQIAMIKAAEIMMNELTKEGFEVLDIREYFTQLIANDI